MSVRMGLCRFLVVFAVGLVPCLVFAQTEDDADKVAIEDIDLEALLSNEIRAGDAGSFGLRLSEYGITVELHAYISAEIKGKVPERSQTLTFDLHHQVINARASLYDLVMPELQLEWEHAGTEFYVPLAQIDFRVAPWMIVRAGYFPVPLGVFNEHQYPDFLRKTVNQPMMTREIIPSLWSEAGLQLRGKFKLAAEYELNYAVYVVNGLEQKDLDPDDGVIDNGGSIRGMRRNDRDKNHINKAVGGRIGMKISDALSFGFSGYTGAYTVDALDQLSLIDVDLTARVGNFLTRVEAVVAIQERRGTDSLIKTGAYILVAYRGSQGLEPFVQIETAKFDNGDDSDNSDANDRFMLGVIYYPYPNKLPNTQVKVEASVTRNHDASQDLIFGGVVQAVVAF